MTCVQESCAAAATCLEALRGEAACSGHAMGSVFGRSTAMQGRGDRRGRGGRESPPERSLSFLFLLSILALKFL